MSASAQTTALSQQQISDASLSSSNAGTKDEKLPVHVLMLSPGSLAFRLDKRKPSNEKSTRPNPQPGCDLIEQRWLHRERVRGLSGTNTDISFYSLDEIENNGALWIGASPLEIAMIDCCTCDDLGDDEHGVSGNEIPIKGRTRLKRNRDDEDDYLPSDEEANQKVDAHVNEVIQNRPKLTRGSLRRGREAHFLSLMARHCYSLSDRSLALAVLARTVQADKDEELIHKHKERLYQKWKQDNTVKLSPLDASLVSTGLCLNATDRISNESSDFDHGTKETAEKTVTPEMDKDYISIVEPSPPGKLPVPIITTFLTMGGMKVLNQWLQEAFTPIVSVISRATDVSSAQRQKANSTTPSKKRSSSNTTDTSKVSMVASRTIALLPVLLKLLQDMPFHKALVYETQINKQIRRLKKGLDKTMLKFENESIGTTNREYYRDPNYGSLPVFQLQKAVEILMNVWKEAVIVSNNSPQPEYDQDPVPNSFVVLQQDLRKMFEASFPHLPWAKLGEPIHAPSRSKPLIKESKAGKIAPSSTNAPADVKKIESHDEELKAMQARLDAKKKIMELYRQKMAEASNNKLVVETTGRGNNTRRVTWPDISRKGFLVEVREYIVDSYHGHEENSRDFSSEIREEQHDFERRRLLNMTYIEEDDDEDDDIFS